MASIAEAVAPAAAAEGKAVLPAFLAARPLATLCIVFIAGVALGNAVRISPAALAAAAVAGGAGCLLARRSRKALASILLGAAVLFAGAAWRSVTVTLPANDVSRFASTTPRRLRGTVASPIRAIRGVWLFTLDAESVLDGGAWRAVTGKASVRTYVEPTYDFGSRLEVRARIRPVPAPGAPGFSGYARYRWLQGVHASTTLGKASVVRADPPRRRSLAVSLNRARQAIKDRMHGTMPGPNSGLYADLVASIVFGVSAAPLPRAIVEDFRRTGTMHVLVVSGAQVSLLAVALILLCRGRRTRIRLWHVLLILPVLIFFCAVVGYGAPVRRALSVCLLLLFAGVSRRDYDPYTAMAVAAFIMLVIDPLNIESVSAQLSFAAAFGVIYFQPRKRSDDGPRPLWRRILVFTVCGTIGAWLMTLPLAAHHFNSFPTLAVLTNLLVLPLVGVLVPTGMIASLFSFVIPPVAVAINHFNRLLADLIVAAVHFGARLPFGFESNVHMPWHAVGLWYAALIGGVTVARSGWREHLEARKIIPVALVILAVVALWWALSLPPGHLTFTMLDVGDGECLLVQSPSGRTMMIDGGERTFRRRSDVARRVILPDLLAKHVTRLDYLVVTHPHDDHVNGLADVLTEIPVGTIIEGGTRAETYAYQRYEQTAQSLRVPRRRAIRGQKIDLGGGAVVAVFSPGPVPMSGTDDDVNNNCVVLKLVYGDVSFLLMGDLQAEGEAKLLRARVEPNATILKIGHHGSAASTSGAFLARVQPEVALISCSNAFGLDHPSPEVVQRLRASGIRIYRTDVHGAITVTTDGRTYRVRASRARP